MFENKLGGCERERGRSELPIVRCWVTPKDNRGLARATFATLEQPNFDRAHILARSDRSRGAAEGFELRAESWRVGSVE